MVRAETPEDRELVRKLLELGQLEEILADRELALATLTVDLRGFELRYARAVGVLLAELDQIEAEIAEQWAKSHPTDEQAKERVRRTRERFEASSQTARAAAAAIDPSRTDDSLRALYRDVARQLHPDLATDDDARGERTKLMAKANAAYEAGDTDALNDLLRNWAGRPESVIGASVGAQLVRAIRKLDQVRARLKAIESEMAELRASDVHKLMQRASEAKASGRDLLVEMAAQVTGQIRQARSRLSDSGGAR